MQTAYEMMDSKETRDVIAMHAYTSGLKAGAVAAAVTGTGVYNANQHWKAFRTRLGVSGKWGLVVSSFVGAFAIVSETRLLHGARNPEKYLASMAPGYVEERAHESHRLRMHERFANHVYDHPYRTLATVGVPLVGGIFAYQNTNSAITSAQKIMHTRLYGQAAVVALLLSSMAFHDYMQKRGRFEAPLDDDDVASQHHAL
ncbi:hypothetical protein PybrP1_001596 [[Pythium] brassicae (nom. inval.)]|nr:hypothetical protein PybrP1_001596 [[Pythium] brassicae (nom. inval.)]